jgi:hypothetical protein
VSLWAGALLLGGAIRKARADRLADEFDAAGDGA